MFLLYMMLFPNGKRYIGITKNLTARKNKHKYRSNKQEYSHLKLYRAINKYGHNSISWYILGLFSDYSKLCVAEIKTISMLKTTDNQFGYNTTLGGEGHLGLSLSESSRNKISKANKGRPKPKGFSEHLSKIRTGKNNPMFGMTTSNKQKLAVSKSGSGEKNNNSKISNKQAREIRDMYKTGNYLKKDLSQLFGLGRNAINKIINNKSYKDPLYDTSHIKGIYKLTYYQAEEIRLLCRNKKYTKKDIANMFGVSYHTILRISQDKIYTSP